MMGSTTAHPYAEGIEMIKKYCVSGTYSFVKPYMGADMMRPMPSASYTSSRNSKGISYNLNLGSSATYNDRSGSLYRPGGNYTGLKMRDPLADMLMQYR